MNKKFLTPLIFVISISGLSYLNSIATKSNLPDKKFFVPPPKILNNFAFGFNEAIGSLLWLRLLQDFEYCESDKQKFANMGETLNEVLDYKNEGSRCNKGWVFHMLDRVTDLNPHFFYAYNHGGLILSIVVDDREGARLLMEKGLEIFPDNYHLNYQAAYHYLYEIQEPKRAAQLLMRASHAGGPQWLSTLAARLYSETGASELAVAILTDVIETHNGTDIAEHAKRRLREVVKKGRSQ